MIHMYSATVQNYTLYLHHAHPPAAPSQHSSPTAHTTVATYQYNPTATHTPVPPSQYNTTTPHTPVSTSQYNTTSTHTLLWVQPVARGDTTQGYAMKQL